MSRRDARAERIGHRLQEAARHFGPGAPDIWRAAFEDLEALEVDFAASIEIARAASQSNREVAAALGHWVRRGKEEGCVDGAQRLIKTVDALLAENRRLREALGTPIVDYRLCDE